MLDNYSVMTAAISVTISQTISLKNTLVLNGTYFYEILAIPIAKKIDKRHFVRQNITREV